MVLREDTRPPAYGDKYSEVASRTFYSRYMEYKKRVAHANAGGAIQREVVSMAELIPSHVQKVFARVYHATRTITPTQLVVAVQSHAGHGEGAEVDLSETSAAVAKAVAMDSKGKRYWRELNLLCLTSRSFLTTTLTSRQCILSLIHI